MREGVRTRVCTSLLHLIKQRNMTLSKVATWDPAARLLSHQILSALTLCWLLKIFSKSSFWQSIGIPRTHRQLPSLKAMAGPIGQAEVPKVEVIPSVNLVMPRISKLMLIHMFKEAVEALSCAFAPGNHNLWSRIFRFTTCMRLTSLLGKQCPKRIN